MPESELESKDGPVSSLERDDSRRCCVVVLEYAESEEGHIVP